MRDLQEFLKDSAQQRRKNLTAEQERRRSEVDARNRRLQEKGVPQPKSGTWGKA